MAIDVAWIWRKYRPVSVGSKWYEGFAADQSSRIRRTMLVALARKFLVARWRYAETCAAPGDETADALTALTRSMDP